MKFLYMNPWGMGAVLGFVLYLYMCWRFGHRIIADESLFGRTMEDPIAHFLYTAPTRGATGPALMFGHFFGIFQFMLVGSILFGFLLYVPYIELGLWGH